jgi:RHS repeat-associated protein
MERPMGRWFFRYLVLRSGTPKLIISILVLSLSAAFGQINTPDDQAGTKAFQPNHRSDIDSVNVATGNLTLHIPLLSYPQRGGALKVSYELLYNGKLAQYQTFCDERAGTCNPSRLVWSQIQGPHFGGGFYLPAGVYPNEVNQVGLGTKGIAFFWPTSSQTKYNASILTLYQADGSGHILGNTGTNTRANGLVTESGPWRTLDGTGWEVQTDFATVLSPNGVVYKNGLVTDPNGNWMQYGATSLTDTLGRQIPNPPSTTSPSNTDTSGCTGPLAVTLAVLWTPPGYGGSNASYKFCYATVQVQPRGYGTTTVFPNPMLQSVVLPNSTSYTFEYDDRNAGDANTVNYGSLTKITLPTGGTISYTYADGSVHTTSTDGQSDTTAISRWVASKTVTDDNGSHTWTYGSTTFDPNGNATVHQFTIDYDGTPHETGILYYQGAVAPANLLKNVQITFNAPVTTNFQGKVNYLPVTRTTTLGNGQVFKQTYTYDSGFTFQDILSTQGQLPVNYGNVVTETDYDYGASLVLKQTTTNYQFQSNNNYLSANLLKLPSSVILSDSSGNTCAETDYNYDATGFLTTSGITTQHTTPPSAVRGNLTSMARQLSSTPCTSGATWSPITSTNNVYDTGEIYQLTDPLGRNTTYTYDALGAYVTQTQLPTTGTVQHITHDGYDPNTGLRTSHQDQNSKSTTYSYDDMNRIHVVTYPASDTTGTGGGTTTYTYNDTPGSLSIEIQQTMTGTQHTDEFMLFDSIGREIGHSKANGESTPWDKTDTCYDGLGQKNFVSYPYQASSSNAAQVCSGAGDSYTHDALGRVTQVVHSDSKSVVTSYVGAATSVTDEGNGTGPIQTVSQVDALGRLVSVCEMTSKSLSFGPTTPTNPCNSLISGAGFPTTYQYDPLGNLTSVTQSGLNTRSFTYDSLSRLLVASNPESGKTCYGTWSGGYGVTCVSGYDADGNMTQRTKLAPNQTGTATVTTTYHYDALNRLTSKTYSDGTTLGAYYYYDQASAWSTTLNNPIGRMTSEGTNNGTSWITTGNFSYDPMGRPTLNAQTVPTQYTLNYGYDFAGNVTSLGNGVGVTFSPAYNVTGRVTSVGSSWNDSAHPATLLSGVSYNPWGSEVAAGFGNGVSDARQYYPRGWLNTVTESGMFYSPGVAGSGSITLSGVEGSNAASSATVTITGSEQSRAGAPATKSTGTMTVRGASQCEDPPTCRTWDDGDVNISASGHKKSAIYGTTQRTAALVASDLANQFNGDSTALVTATTSTSIITFTSRATGSSTNYQLVGTVDVLDGGNDFSFAATPVTMTGGKDVGPTVYDAGTVFLTVDGYQASAAFDNVTNNTPSKIATALAASLNASTVVSAVASGANITITSKAFGANTNYTLTYNPSTSSQGFSPPSFQVTGPATLAGGRNPAGATHVYDAGTATVTVNGYQAQVAYGQSSTPTTIATALATAISGSPDVTATASGATITVTARTIGSNTNYAVTKSVASGNGFSPASFAVGAPAALSGGLNLGLNPGTIYALSLGYAGNGDLTSANDSANGNWTYAYDDFNRLTTSTCGGGCAGSYSYGYDRFGNRWQQKVTSGTGFNVNYSFDTNNRIVGGSYDTAGNLTSDGTHSYFYDAENRIVNVDAGSSVYVYDAEGRRTSKTTGGVTLDYLYDLAGHQIAEVTSTGTVNRQEIYAGGSHLGTYTAGTTYFHHEDWLGTERVRSDMTAQACETVASLPFGDGQTTSGNCGDPSPMHFTGKMRDTESGLDDFPARYYSSTQGRWLSPDWSVTPEPVPYVKLGDPQTLNLYAYVGNDPTNHADPDGHEMAVNGVEGASIGSGWKAEEGWNGSMGGGLPGTASSAPDPIGDTEDQAQNQGQQIPGTPFTITNFEGAEFSNHQYGVAIGATANCSDCSAWVQTFTRTGEGAAAPGRELVDKGNTAASQLEHYADIRNPVYGGGNHFSDMPTAPKGGSFKAIVWAGSADLKKETFTTHAAFAYGFSVSKSGKLTVTAPRATTKAERTQSLKTIRTDSHPWTIN